MRTLEATPAENAATNALPKDTASPVNAFITIIIIDVEIRTPNMPCSPEGGRSHNLTDRITDAERGASLDSIVLMLPATAAVSRVARLNFVFSGNGKGGLEQLASVSREFATAAREVIITSERRRRLNDFIGNEETLSRR